MKKYNNFILNEEHIKSFFEKISDFGIDEFKGYLELGIDINKQDEDGNTILHILCEYDKTEHLRLLFTYDRLDLNIKNDIQERAFDMDIEDEIIELFLKDNRFKLETQDIEFVFLFSSITQILLLFEKMTKENIDIYKHFNQNKNIIKELEEIYPDEITKMNLKLIDKYPKLVDLFNKTLLSQKYKI